MQPTDKELVTAYLEAHDQRAFEMLVERHQERIFGYLLGMVRNRDVAEDLFQETFFRVISAMQKKRGSYSHEGRWLAWVMRIARNAALDYLRSRKKWQDVDGQTHSEDGTSYWERLPADNMAADEIIHRMEQRAWLNELIAELSPEQREVLLLRQKTDLTFREIAELQQVSINTALGRMRYALANLRKMIRMSKKKNLANA